MYACSLYACMRIGLCLCLCVCGCMPVCICVCVCVHCMCLRVYMHMCVRRCLCVCRHVRMCVYVCMRVSCVYACMRGCMYMCVTVWAPASSVYMLHKLCNVCMPVWLPVRMHVRTYACERITCCLNACIYYVWMCVIVWMIVSRCLCGLMGRCMADCGCVRVCGSANMY